MRPEYARKEDGPALRALWRACFPDDGEAFADYFFTRLFRPENALVYRERGKTLSMLHMMPFEIRINGLTLPVSYLYGVGTDPGRRGEGLARSLLDQALFEMHLRGTALALLIPQERRLFGYYEKSGFEPVFFLGREYVSAAPEAKGARRAERSDVPALNAFYERKMRGRTHVVRTPAHWAHILEEAELSGGGVFVLYGGEKMRAYAVCAGGGDPSEAFGADEEAKRNVIRASAPAKEVVSVPCPAGNRDARPFGCARVVDAGLCLAALRGGPDGEITVTDGLCPWNARTFVPGSGGGHAVLTQEELVRGIFLGGPAGRPVSPPYMNLMHN